MQQLTQFHNDVLPIRRQKTRNQRAHCPNHTKSHKTYHLIPKRLKNIRQNPKKQIVTEQHVGMRR